jgi:carboxyl-terminal processing protease
VTQELPAAVRDGAPGAARYFGLWQSQGYGWILALGLSGYRLHHATAANLVNGEGGSLDDFDHAFDRVEFEDPDALTCHQAGDLTRYRFVQIDRLPDVPRYDLADPVEDPLASFMTLARVFEEQYAFFALHGVDWPAICERERRAAAAATSATELFDVFSRMLEPLDDGHVTLSGAGLFHQRRRNPELRAAMQATFGTPDGRISARATKDAIAAHIDAVLLSGHRGRSALKQAGNGTLSWCELEPGIGYVSVLRLFGFADSDSARRASDLPHSRRDVADFLARDLLAFEAALDAAFSDLAGCRALVLDVRFNGGGFDRLGLALAARFADRPRVAFTKRARDGTGTTPEQAITIEPHRHRFGGPVVALTSPLCVSAGEVLTLALRALPHVTVMGERTAGMLSDNLLKPLPNGWEVSLSNEIYAAHDGLVFEGLGVEPDVAAVSMDAAQLVPSLHASLQAAVERLGGATQGRSQSPGRGSPRETRPRQ